MEQSLRKLGVDKPTARKLLSVWQAAGVSSPETLRKLFLRRSASKSRQVAVQLLIDLTAAAGSFWAAQSLTTAELGPLWTLPAKSVCFFLACYLSISAAFDAFSLGAVLFAGVRYSSNADAFLLAVQDLAGSPSALGLVDRAKQAVNIVKVLQALDAILALLKVRARCCMRASSARCGLRSTTHIPAQDSAASPTFFEDLSAYLTLERAQRLYGFDVERFASVEEAAEAAGVFARYDENNDGLISLDEFRRWAGAWARQGRGARSRLSRPPPPTPLGSHACPRCAQACQ